MVPQTVRSAPNTSLSTPLGSAPFNAFSIPSTPSGHVPLNDHEYSLFEILLNQQVKEHPTSEAFLQHVAQLLAQAELGRILHNGTNLSKNECGAIFVGLAWGTGKTVHNGGEGECIDLTRGPNSQGCVHHKRGRMWVINTHCHYLTGIAWRSDTQAPVRFFEFHSQLDFSFDIELNLSLD